MKERYKNSLYQAAYENACDCLYYGMSSKVWNDCGIDKEKRAEIWKLAFYDMAEPDIEHGKMIDDTYHYFG